MTKRRPCSCERCCGTSARTPAPPTSARMRPGSVNGQGAKVCHTSSPARSSAARRSSTTLSYAPGFTETATWADSSRCTIAISFVTGVRIMSHRSTTARASAFGYPANRDETKPTPRGAWSRSFTAQRPTPSGAARARASIAMRTHRSAQSGTVTKPRRNVPTDGIATPAMATGQTRDSAAMIDRNSCLSFET